MPIPDIESLAQNQVVMVAPISSSVCSDSLLKAYFKQVGGIKGFTKLDESSDSETTVLLDFNDENGVQTLAQKHSTMEFMGKPLIISQFPVLESLKPSCSEDSLLSGAYEHIDTDSAGAQRNSEHIPRPETEASGSPVTSGNQDIVVDESQKDGQSGFAEASSEPRQTPSSRASNSSFSTPVADESTPSPTERSIGSHSMSTTASPVASSQSAAGASESEREAIAQAEDMLFGPRTRTTKNVASPATASASNNSKASGNSAGNSAGILSFLDWTTVHPLYAVTALVFYIAFLHNFISRLAVSVLLSIFRSPIVLAPAVLGSAAWFSYAHKDAILALIQKKVSNTRRS